MTMHGIAWLYRVVMVVAVMLVAPLPALDPAALAAPMGQSQFPPGAVVALQGTPHLWIADAEGVLHWGGDTRALAGKFVDWNVRIQVSLPTMRSLLQDDPYLSLGLLQDGQQIYLPKWETNEPAPRLLHIQCISDVELFGINGANYGSFIRNRTAWESFSGMQVSRLQRAELERTDPSVTACPPPRIKLQPRDINQLAPALQQYGLQPSDVNVDLTVTFGLPSSIVDPGANPITALSAPLDRPPTTVARGMAIGVLKAGRSLSLAEQVLPPGMYLVVVRGGTPGQMVFVSGGSNPRDIQTSLTPEYRRMSRDVTTPQAVMMTGGLCFSWQRTQVCSRPSPRDAMTVSEQNRMDTRLNNAVRALVAARHIRGPEIDTASALPDVAGSAAVGGQVGSLLAAPIFSTRVGDWPEVMAASIPRPDAQVGVRTTFPALIGIMAVEMEIEIPAYPLVRSGSYAVFAKPTGATWAAELRGADGSLVEIPADNVELLGESLDPAVVIVGLGMIVPDFVPPLSLCFFREPCL